MPICIVTVLWHIIYHIQWISLNWIPVNWTSRLLLPCQNLVHRLWQGSNNLDVWLIGVQLSEIHCSLVEDVFTYLLGECFKPRCIYSEAKLTLKEKEILTDLERDFTCIVPSFITISLNNHSPNKHHLSKSNWGTVLGQANLIHSLSSPPACNFMKIQIFSLFIMITWSNINGHVCKCDN